ncbi:hypothetical protein GCM10010913_47120 [Paenibacillus aceti]|uniref:Uncharacterized protein n=1 Tax=Paenibacillus aceti TaxID=1820010 RepID=A0ABQ1W8X7_9BACL|nr:hypothetical protein GCM10010913_47120 [Paenibacillus aceti]
MRKQTDLSLVFYYGDHPVRVGRCGKDVIYSLSDLLKALNVTSNVTHITRGLPEETFYKGSYVDLETGTPVNGHAVVVTYEGANLTLPRLRGADLYDVLMLTRWMRTVKADKIKGA